MGKREEWNAGFELDNEEEEEGHETASKGPVIELSSDDDEANEDLSLRLVERATRSQPAKAAQNGIGLDRSEDCEGAGSGGVIDMSSRSTPGVELAPEPAGEKIGMKKGKEKRKRKKKEKTFETEEGTVDAVEDCKKAEVVGGIESGRMEDSVQRSDNVVLRKLLRGPRYFDPPGSGWGSCYNCGEEGHQAAKCTLMKRKKPCFICGSLEHSGKTCAEGKDCFICNRGGHRAKDCPDKNKNGPRSVIICLKCGDSGHDMFFCRNNYSSDDLKKIQCYVCKNFGHLCCAKFEDSPQEVSCYQCGQLGHTGLACTRSGGETPGTGSLNSCYKCGDGGHFARECMKACTRSGVKAPGVGSLSYCYKCGVEGHFARECANAHMRSGGETTSAASLGSCYKCGQEGHFARECTQNGKRNHELLTPTRKSSQKAKDYMGFKSAPNDLGRASKKKRMQSEEKPITTPHKPKGRGGWIAEDPGDLPHQNVSMNGWRSPATPLKKSRSISSSVGGWDRFSNSRSSKKTSKARLGTPTSQSPGKAGKHRFSAVRFGNPSGGGVKGNHNQW